MKKSLLLLALASLLTTTAQAGSWFMPNKAGGRIVLTDRPCPDPAGTGLLEAYTYTPDGTRAAACWTFFDGLIQIGWGRGQRSVFQESDFQRIPETWAPAAPAAPVSRKPVKSL